MKFERLSSNRIKIFVTEDDLDLWGLSVQHIVKNTPEAQEIFWYIIKKAESETGFVAGEARLMVEALPQRGTGILLFMTKLEEEDTTDRKGRNMPLKRPEARAVSFPTFDSVCEAIRGMPLKTESRLYECRGHYVLILRKEGESAAFLRLLEFGDPVAVSDYSMAYLREHGRLLLKNSAVETLHTYFG